MTSLASGAMVVEKVDDMRTRQPVRKCGERDGLLRRRREEHGEALRKEGQRGRERRESRRESELLSHRRRGRDLDDQPACCGRRGQEGEGLDHRREP